MVKAVAGKGGSLAGRLGVKKTGGGVSDARQKIIQSNRSKTGDAWHFLKERGKVRWGHPCPCHVQVPQLKEFAQTHQTLICDGN